MPFDNNEDKIFINSKYNKFNPSVNEWVNSIYTFNKKSINYFNDKLNYDLINSYFNARPYYVKKTTYKHKQILNKELILSLDRIFVSMPEFKHTLQNLNLVLYVFNKEEILLLFKLNKLKKCNTGYFIKEKNLSKLSMINNTSNGKIWDGDAAIYSFNNIYSYINGNLRAKYYKIFLYKSYLAKLYFNKFVFSFSNLLYLKKILSRFNNNIEVNINIINLKYLYLDNHLFLDAITRKLVDRNKRALRVLRKALILPKIPLIESILLINKKIFNINSVYENIVTKVKSNYLVYNSLKSLTTVRKSIYKTMKNIHIIGVRLEGRGRLTRRLTASRAIYKRAYLGTLRNIYSSFQGLRSTINRGFNKSSVNYSIRYSNNRNGSFGIKSWQNTM